MATPIVTVPGQGSVPVILYQTKPTAAAAAAEAARDLAITARNAAQTAQAAAEAAQVAAKTSETNAKTSETNALASKTAAATSATQAATSASTASTSATTASTAASTASTSATAASGSATTASNAASVATTAMQDAQAAANEVVTASAGQSTITGTLTLSAADVSKPTYFRRKLVGNVTLAALPNGVAMRAYTVTLELQQDATGNRTWAWPSNVKWPGSMPFVVSKTANMIDVVHLFWNGYQWFGGSGLVGVTP